MSKVGSRDSCPDLCSPVPAVGRPIPVAPVPAVGHPIPVPQCPQPTEEQVDCYHVLYMKAVEQLLEEHRRAAASRLPLASPSSIPGLTHPHLLALPAPDPSTQAPHQLPCYCANKSQFSHHCFVESLWA